MSKVSLLIDSPEDDATEGAVFAAVNARATPLRVVRLSSKRFRDWKGSAFEQVAERVATELRATFRANERAELAPPGAAVSTAPPVPRAQPLERVGVRPTDNNVTNIGAGLARNRLANAVATGALAGAAIGGGLSVVSNGVALKKGEKAVATATLDTLKDTASSSATGAVVGGLALATQATLLRAGATGLASGAAPVAIALVAVDVGKGASRLLVGEIDGREFTRSSGLQLAKGGFTWVGMEGGAALGTAVIPGIGTAVGALIGGIAGALVGGWVARAQADNAAAAACSRRCTSARTAGMM